MTKICTENMRLMQERYPEVKELLERQIIEEAEKEKAEALMVDLEEIEGRKILYAVKGIQQFQLDSLYDSDYILNTWFSGLHKLRFHSKIIMFGLGNGMYAQKLLKETKNDVAILIYEPSLIVLRKVMEHFDLCDILGSERVVLYVKDCMPLTFGECLQMFIQYEDLSGLIQRKYLNYSKLFVEEADYFTNEIKMKYSYEDAEVSLWERHGVIYYNNTVSNISKLYQSKDLYYLWENIPKTLPAIVVAAGPSLDKNIELLKEAKGRCLLIAADSALKPLLNHDIIPDLFVSVDGGKLQSHFTDERMKQIPLVCNLQSQEFLIQQHEAEKFFIRGLDIYIQKFMENRNIEMPVLSTGGSVAHDCFELARVLGLKTIILVGQDLAYTNHKTHSAETVRGGRGTNIDTLQTIKLESIDGSPILSSPEFQIYLNWFEDRIRKYPELKVIDATEGGAKIPGTIIQPLEKTISEECKEVFDVERIIREANTLLTVENQAEFKQYIQQIPTEIKRAVCLMKQCMKDYEKILTLTYQDKYQTKPCLRLFQNISRTTKQIENISAIEYLQSHLQSETTQMLDRVYDIEKDEKKEIIEVCRIGKKYLQDMQDIAVNVIIDLNNKLL